MTLEQQLRETFERHAGSVRPPIDAYGVVITRHRAAQRHRLATAAVVAGLVIAAGVPITLEVVDGSPPSYSSAESPAEWQPPAPRGSLVNDTEFMAAVLDTHWVVGGTEMVEVPAADRHVLFAGDVPGARWARLVAQVGGQWYGLWLGGDPGAPGTSLTSVGESDQDAVGVQYHGDFNLPEAPLVVLAAPGDIVEVSERAEVTAAGEVIRSYQQIDAPGGLAVTGIPGARSRGTAVRVTRAGVHILAVGGIRGALDRPTWTDGQITALSSPARGEPAESVVRAALDAITLPTGLDPGQVNAEVLWGGAIDATDPTGPSAIVAAVEIPSGASVVVGWYGSGQGEELSIFGPCSLAITPLGTPRPDLVPMRCDVQVSSQSAAMVSWLVVVAPTGASVAQAMAGDVLVAEVALTDGVGSIPFPAGVDRVVALDPEGVALADEPIAAPVTDLGLYGNPVEVPPTD